MKVSAVCPSCGRPAASKGRNECLYCGADLQAIPTGQVTAPGSGQPIPITPPTGEAPAPRPSTRKVEVPLLYQERAAKMQAAGVNPVAEFLASGTGKAVLVVLGVVLFTGGLIGFINKWSGMNINPTNYKGTSSRPEESASGPAEHGPVVGVGGRPPEASTKSDAQAALDRIGQAIERVGARDGEYPDYVPGSLVGLVPGNDFEAELAHFAGGKVSYSRSIDPVTNDQTFTVEAISRETGERLSVSGKLKVGGTFVPRSSKKKSVWDDSRGR